MIGQEIILPYRHTRTVGKSIDPSKYSYKSQNVLAGRSSSSNAGKVDYVKAARELAAKQRYAKLQGAEPSFSHRHPIITAVGKYLGKKALGAAGHALFASVNHEIEHLLFEMEETPNYYVQVLMSKGGVGDKSFRRHTIATIALDVVVLRTKYFPKDLYLTCFLMILNSWN